MFRKHDKLNNDKLGPYLLSSGIQYQVVKF